MFVQELRAMKVNSVLYFGPFIVRRTRRDEWKLGETTGDWLNYGGAVYIDGKLVARLAAIQ